MRIVAANYSDHKELLKLARQSPYTKGFADVRYVQEYYERDWILRTWNMAAFACIRHCVRSPWTTIYYLGVAPEARGKGLGAAMVREISLRTPHGELRCGVDEANLEGQAFWKAMGFRRFGLATTNKKGGRIIQLRKIL